MNSKPEKHVFVCTNCRSGKLSSCGDKGLAIRSKLKAITQKEQLNNVRVNKSGCLDICHKGPALVIYPSGIWYNQISIEDCEEIFEKSIRKDEIIQRLNLKNEDLLD